MGGAPTLKTPKKTNSKEATPEQVAQRAPVTVDHLDEQAKHPESELMKMALISSEELPEHQKDRLNLLKKHLSNIGEKIKKSAATLPKELLGQPTTLSDAVAFYKISLNKAEETALYNYNRLVKEGGPTGTYVEEGVQVHELMAIIFHENEPELNEEENPLVEVDEPEAAEEEKISTPTDSEVRQLNKIIQEGGDIPDALKETFMNAGGAWPKILEKAEIMAKKNHGETQTEKKVEEAEVGTPETPEILDEKEVEASGHYLMVSMALMSVYQLEGPEFNPVLEKINNAFTLCSEVKLQRLLLAYEINQKKGSKEISFEQMGIPPNPDTSPEALFLMAKVVHGARDYHEKRKGHLPENTTVNDFFNELSKDPSLNLMSGMQESIKQKIGDLNLDSLSLLSAGGKIFSKEVIDGALDTQKEASIMHLAERYGIDIEGFSETERNQFLLIITKFYGNSAQKLEVGSEVIQASVDKVGGSKDVKKAAVQFWEKLKQEAKPALDACIKRYDIIRTDNKKDYNQVLKNNLTFDKLHFEDGLKLVLLAEGIDFETKAESEGMEQGREVLMMFLMAGILEKRDPEAHAKYAVNLMEVARHETGVNFNVNLEPIQPYLNKLFEVGVRKVKEKANFIKILLGGSDVKKDPEALAKMEAGEFTGEFIMSGLSGGIQIPVELASTLIENFGRLGSAEDILDAIGALGGMTVISEKDGETLGLVALGGKYYFIKPAQIALDTLYAASTQNLSTGVKSYLVGTAPYIAIGSAVGIARGGLKGVSMLRSTIGGFSRGMIAPINLPIQGYRHIRGAGRGIEHMSNTYRYGSRNAQNLMRSAELFQEYSQKADIKSTGMMSKGGAVLSEGLRGAKYQAQRFIYKDIYEAARLRWGKRFAIDYNSFFGVNPNLEDLSVNKITAIGHNDVANFDSLKKIAGDMQSKLKKLGEIQDLDRLSKPELIERLKTVFGETSDEFRALEERMAKDGDGIKGVKKSIRSLLERNTEGVATPYIAGPAEKFSTPKSLGEASYQYKGEKFIVSEADIQSRMSTSKLTQEQALKALCEEQWNRPRALKTVKAGTLYRFRGGQFLLSPEEAKLGSTEMTTLIEEKYIRRMKIEGTRTVGKVEEFKIGGRWIRIEEGDDAVLAAKKSYLEAAKKAGIPLNHMETASPRLNKLISYYPALEKMMGPAVAAGMVYHISTAPDKRKAVAESVVGYGSFIGGAKLANKISGNPTSIPGIIGKGAFVVFGGMATAMGVTEPLSKIVEENAPRWRGDQEMLVEGNDIFAKVAGRSVIKKLTPFLSKKIGGRIMATLTKKSVMGVAILANDASGIGVVDDILLAGWAAYDVVKIAQIYLKAKDIEHALNNFKRYPEYTIKPIGSASEDTWHDAVEALGKPVSSLNEKEMDAFLEDLGDITLRFNHKGIAGFEQYRYVQGKVVETLIETPEGEKLSLTDQELNQEIALPLPQEFDKRRVPIDYENDSAEVLKAKYRSAIFLVKSETEWTKLKYEKENITEDGFDLMRHDGNAATTLTRSGDKWTLIDKKTGVEFASGLDIFQAIVIANLKNKVEQVLDKEGHSGGSSRPFSLDGQRIDFDRSFNPMDLSVLSTTGLDFYNTMEVSQRDVVNALNDWYQKSS